jgi:hypothetical protein
MKVKLGLLIIAMSMVVGGVEPAYVNGEADDESGVYLSWDGPRRVMVGDTFEAIIGVDERFKRRLQ